MIYMIRGTTPTLTFNLPFDVSNIKTVWVTFSHKGKEVFTIETGELQLNDTKVTAKLTQAQTLALEQNTLVEVQLRILTNGGEALASNVMRTGVDKILKDGEIT